MKNITKLFPILLASILLFASCTIGTNTYKTAHLDLIKSKNKNQVVQKVQPNHITSNLQYSKNDFGQSLTNTNVNLEINTVKNSTNNLLSNDVSIDSKISANDSQKLELKQRKIESSLIRDAKHSTPPEGKSQLVALLLAIFLGSLGIQRFYLGYTGIGVIQLLTAGGCGIWTLIDVIRIAIGDLKPRDGDYKDKL